MKPRGYLNGWFDEKVKVCYTGTVTNVPGDR